MTTTKGGTSRYLIRDIVAGLYGVNMQKRFEAALALGRLAKDDPDAVTRVWNRIFYAFDDTMSCWGAAEGLGEIARNMPGMRTKILALLRKFAADEASCQGFVWAVCRIGQVDRQLIEDIIPDLERAGASPAACMVGQTLWALGELGIAGSEDRLKAFLEDIRETWIYENDAVRHKTLGEIAGEALKKLQGRQGL
ncbi:MAG: hypothetical protein M0Z79_00140 [Nitrospiraceae bacterium]|nr:hypothetical protein [Nitrospiraceae bacterium]